MYLSNLSAKSGDDSNAVVLTSDGKGNIRIQMSPGRGVSSSSQVLSFRDPDHCKNRPEESACVHLNHVGFKVPPTGTCESKGNADGLCDIYIVTGSDGVAGKYCRNTLA